MTAKGEIIYSEVVRENVRKLEAYVEEMASTDNVVEDTVNMQKIPTLAVHIVMYSSANGCF